MYTLDIGRELAIVNGQKARARAADLPATLTVGQWVDTLKAYGGRCAYCASEDYQELDHIVPVSMGGPTTRENCVPACSKCNRAKGNNIWSPYGVREMPRRALRTMVHEPTKLPGC